jgi:ubiquinone/menaquinone biosynthesis C-methylase UbiE
MQIAYGVEPSNRAFRLRLARYPHMVELMKRVLNGRTPVEVLDIGPGKGRTVSFSRVLLGRDDVRYYGVDISSVRLARSARHPYNGLFLGDGRQLPFRTGRFDIVVAMHVLEHVAQTDKFLDEIKRVLKPGGHLILGIPLMPNEVLMIQSFMSPLIDWYDHVMHNHRDHEAWFSRQSIEKFLKHHGFKIHDLTGFRLFSLPANLLEDYRWWYRFQGWLGRILPSLSGEVNILAQKA